MAAEKPAFHPLPEDMCLLLRKYTGTKLATTSKDQYIKDYMFYKRKIETFLENFHIQFEKGSQKNVFYFDSTGEASLNIGKDLSLLVNFCNILEELVIAYKTMHLLPTFSPQESLLFNLKLGWLLDESGGFEKKIALFKNPVISFMLALFCYNYARYDERLAGELKKKFGAPRALLENAQKLGCINAQALLEVISINDQNKVAPSLWAKVFNPRVVDQIENHQLPVDSRGRAIARLLAVNPKAQELVKKDSNFLACNLATFLCAIAQIFPPGVAVNQFWLKEFDPAVSNLIQVRDQQFQQQERAAGRNNSVLHSQNVVSPWRLRNLLELIKNNNQVFKSITELQLLDLVAIVDSLLECFTSPGLFDKWAYEEVIKFLGAEYRELRTNKVLACLPNIIRLVAGCEELKEFVRQISSYLPLSHYAHFFRFEIINLTEIAAIVVKNKNNSNGSLFINLMNNINHMAAVSGSPDKFVVFLDDLFKLHVEVVVKNVFLENRIEISRVPSMLTPDCLMSMPNKCIMGKFFCFMWAPLEIVRYIARNNNSKLTNMLLGLSYKEYQQLRCIIGNLSNCELLIEEGLEEDQNISLLHWVLENLEGLTYGFEKITVKIKKYHLLLLRILKHPIDALPPMYHTPGLIPGHSQHNQQGLLIETNPSQADQHPTTSVQPKWL